VRLLAVGVLGASLSHASIISSVYDTTLPALAPGASSIGLGAAGSNVVLFTTKRYFTSPLYNGGLSFDVQSDPSVGIPLTLQSVALADPSDPSEFYFSAKAGPFLRIYTYKTNPESMTSVPTPLTGFPDGIAIDGTGAEYLTGPGANGVLKFSSPASFTPLFEFGASGPGTLNTPTALAMGPDGLLYVLDTGNNRIASFDSDGDYIGGFSLPGGFSPDTLAIDGKGWLYTANGNGGGDIYNIYTGSVVGSFNSVGSNPTPTASRTALLASGDSLYLLDQNTGLHVFDTAVPEPGTWALMMAAGVVGVALRRRRPMATQTRTAPCTGQQRLSNATINISGSTSFDGAGTCVIWIKR
jgi:hypothetical protein